MTPSPRTRTRRRAALAGLASAALVAPALALPAAAYQPPGGERDVREFACPPGQVPDAGFTDVPEGDQFTLNINCLAAYEVTQGSSGGMQPTFSPDQPLPRFQMAVFLVRMLEDVVGFEGDETDPEFQDTDGLPEEVQRAIAVLANAGITAGTTATTFSPTDEVERGQLASFLVRMQQVLAASGEPVQGFPSGTDRFTDDEDSVHEPNINALAGEGIVLGQGTTFRPVASVTRAQMAAFLTRYLDLLAEEGALEDPFPRDNETLDVAFLLGQDGGAAQEDQEDTGSASPQDDRAYIASGLESGAVYRVTLVTTDSFSRVDEDEDDGDDTTGVVRFDGDATTFLAGPGTTTARITQVNGSEVEPAQSLTVTATPLGGFQFTIDAEDATEVAPFVYPDPPASYVSYSPRLELAEDLRPVEVFGVGDPTSWTEPSESSGPPSP